MTEKIMAAGGMGNSLAGRRLGLLVPSRAIAMQARLFGRALPARIMIAKSAKARSHGGQAFLKRAVLAVFRNVTAEIQESAPRTFSRPCGICAGGKERRKSGRSENVAQHVQTSRSSDNEGTRRQWRQSRRTCR